ncbi:meiotic recombination protein SPO11-1 isoform X3 [Cryptomeria japonica]|uniref:meiotic recombination protein SPO11-1 isoform X3 n=1 Tax=Cryptomeria japonica TaxID=3369 RepID=UPI0025ABB469|nr:meiotic recombination protein SPO11-1 isoform X3 [Cryptomeria japonica]
MEGREREVTPQGLLDSIKDFTRKLLKELWEGNMPCVGINKYQAYCTLDHHHQACSCKPMAVIYKEVITMETKAAACRLVAMLRILQIIQELLQENKHASKRDIYYTDPAIFHDRTMVDRGIDDVCVYFQCSRHNLNVVSPSKGLVMGWLRFIEFGREVDCTRNICTAYVIPMHVEQVQNITSLAKYILVVEKETVFQRLANDGFCKQNQCIVISQMAYDTKALSAPEIRWLGVFPSDCDTFQIPDRCLLPLTTADKKKVDSMLRRCYLQQHAPEWRYQLDIMWAKGIKFEIEAISASSFSLLSEEYIPTKIKNGLYI